MEAKSHIVIFVEGDTDKVFFEALLNYYRQHSQKPICSCEVQNLKGVSRYTSKVTGKLQNEICPKAKKKGLYVKAVCCSYDTDVFEFTERPVVNWNKVKREVKSIGIKNFCQIKVESMIEDWLLEDLQGLCEYLKLNSTLTISGNTGYDKIQQLFKKANRVYLKGVSIKAFIKYLDLEKIRNKRSKALAELECFLKVRI